MGLAILILGLAIFIGAHVFVSLRDHRERLIARIGEGPYKGDQPFAMKIGRAHV